MSEIILCNQSLKVDSLQDHCGISGQDIRGLGCSKPSMLKAYTPYLVMQDSSTIGEGVLNQLAPMPIARELTHLSLSFGENNVVTLANITAKLQEYNIGLMGAATSVYASNWGVCGCGGKLSSRSHGISSSDTHQSCHKKYC